MDFEKVKSPQWSLCAQVIFFFGAFGVFYIIESRESSETGFSEVLLAYVVWLPAMWHWIPGGFLTYLLLGIIALVSLVISMRTPSNTRALRVFNITAVFWTLFPWGSFLFGDYRGP